MVIAGIDGCRCGWLCLTSDLTTGNVQAQVLPSISDLLSLNPQPSLVMIDIPIGLTDSGPRDCDLDARIWLKQPRCCSVFPAPIRPMLAASNYSEACEIGQNTCGKRLSRQAWGIVPKIREIDTFLRE